jgi:hypothetical protein
MVDEEILKLSDRYLRGQIELREFQSQFAQQYVRSRIGHEVSNLCDSIVLPLAELARGHRSEESFRAEVANAIRPFASSVYRTPEISFRIALSSSRDPLPAPMLDPRRRSSHLHQMTTFSKPDALSIAG